MNRTKTVNKIIQQMNNHKTKQLLIMKHKVKNKRQKSQTNIRKHIASLNNLNHMTS